MALVTKEFKLDLAPGQLRPVVNASQGDIGRPFKADLYWNGSPWTATGYTANIRGRKPDETVFDYTATVDGSTVTFETTEQMTIVSGPVECELVFSNDGDVIASANFVLMVEDSPYNPEAPSESVIPGIEDIVTDVVDDVIGDNVGDWLDEHPEATTTVQDGAITKAKINTAFLPEIENAYVTPEMFGAVGDGVTDDTTAITDAIGTGYLVLFEKRYKMNSNLVVPAGAVLAGGSDKTGGGTEILFAEGTGLEIAGRNVTIKNITLTQTVSGTGSAVKFTNDGYRITVDGLVVNNFNIGLDRRVTLWNSEISNIRFNYCNTLYDSSNATTGTQTLTMFNLHANRCVQIFNCRAGDKIYCVSCNFGIIQYPAFTIESVSAIDFNNCNFECDEHVETGKNMFSIGTRGIRFEHCLFKVNSHADGHVFALFNLSYLEFKNCVYESATGNEMPESNFFNLSYFTTAVYGAVRFNGGNISIPRPSASLTTARWPNWVDVERGKPIEFYQTNILKEKLYRGEILYSYTNKALCVYDGTNIVNVRTGDIIL